MTATEAPAGTRRVALSGLEKAYGPFRLGPLSASLPVGVTALLGANGAGKSTLMKLGVGVTRADRGSVELFPGTDRHEVEVVGYLPQDFAGPKNVSARDYLRFVAWCRSTRSRKLGVQTVDDALDLVGLSPRADSRIGALSGGMVRRLGIAQAVLGGADFLVLDEPTVGLDPIQREEVRDLVQALGEHAVVMLSTHLAEDVAAIADRVLVLDGGAVLFDGSVDELVAHSELDRRSSEAVEQGFLRLVRAGGRHDR